MPSGRHGPGVLWTIWRVEPGAGAAHRLATFQDHGRALAHLIEFAARQHGPGELVLSPEPVATLPAGPGPRLPAKVQQVPGEAAWAVCLAHLAEAPDRGPEPGQGS